VVNNVVGAVGGAINAIGTAIGSLFH
jgi:hypothetical protein